MATHLSLSGREVPPFWLAVVRAAAIAAILPLGAIYSGPLLGLMVDTKQTLLARLMAGLLFVIPVLPYGHVVWRLRQRPEKSGLALAVAWGVPMAGFAVLLIFEEASWPSLLALANAILAGAAIKVYLFLGKDKGDGRTLAWAIATAAIYFGILLLLALIMPNLVRA